MTDIVTIRKFNETYLKVTAEDAGILYELNEHFKFFVDGYKFMPKYKAGIWDGSISLYNVGTKLIYAGLFAEIEGFCETRGYNIDLVDCPAYGLPKQETNVLIEDIKNFVIALDARSKGNKLEIRDYQIDAIYAALKNQRQTILSPTGSGKSFIMYSVARWLLEEFGYRFLVVVPTTTLVHQLKSDFEDYSSHNGFDVEANTHIIMSGKEKKTDKSICISTWQSLVKQQPMWFNQFDCIMVDEVHGAKAAELGKIMEKSTDVKFRFGFTGSLDNSKTNKMVIKGLFGPITKVTSTRKLIDDGHLSDVKIKSIVLNYSADTKRLMKNADYQKEVDFLCQHDRRNKFIRNLALSLEGNTLILYNFIEKHGDVLYDLLSAKVGERKLFYIHGKVDAEERNEVRGILESSKNAIVLASVGTFSTGINIKNLHNIIFASPTKSVIRVLQSVGRGLRKADGKDQCTLFDIGDKLSNSKTKMNYTYNHMVQRLRIYVQEQFPYKIVEVELE